MSQVCDFRSDCAPGVVGGLGADELNCGSCDFEGTDPSTGTPSMCGWTNMGTGKKQWAVISASLSSSRSFLPSNDGSGKYNGKFLIIDTSRGKWAFIRDCIFKQG